MNSNRRGSQFVEASVAIPIIILTVLLLVRVFVFYLEILNMGVKEHELALEKWDAYDGLGYSHYDKTAEVSMLGGGLLSFGLNKQLRIEAYYYNEDRIVRGARLAAAIKE